MAPRYSLRSGLCSVLAAALLCSIPACAGLLGSDLQASLSSSRRFELELEVTLPDNIDVAAGPVRVWVPVPVSDHAQEVDLLQAPQRVRWSPPDRYGNRFAYLLWDGLGARSLRFVYRIHRHQDDGGMDPGDRTMTRAEAYLVYLADEMLVPSSGPAAEIAYQEMEKVGRDQLPGAVYRRVLQEMDYSTEGEGWGHGSADWAAQHQSGDSTDFVAYFTSALRSQDFAVRSQMGYLLPHHQKAGEITRTHSWAHWFRDEHGWQPVDLLEGELDAGRVDYFAEHLGSNRVGLSCGRDLILDPPQSGDALNFFVRAYAEQGGGEVTVVTRLRYRDL